MAVQSPQMHNSRYWIPKLTGLVDGYTINVIVKSRSSISPTDGAEAF